MLTPYSSEDLGQTFDARTITKGRTLVLLGSVAVSVEGPSIAVVVDHMDKRFESTVTPLAFGRRVTFSSTCTCGERACVHMAAGALATLDRFPKARKAGQQTFLDTLTGPATAKGPSLVFELSPGTPPDACFVSCLLVGADGATPTTPAKVLADATNGESARLLAKMLGGGGESRIAVASAGVTSVLGLVARMGKGRWHATGQVLSLGEDRDRKSVV